ncbi:hypothetical protein BD410DRAFT_788620 [Rickenella mellea]|uniref:Uncharacterized protein n=1 Tax=Rickenella mellea TaxID=50990 RepID=A0A4Y7Q577_9AGAM|nr:hypothetical protein BD410DRAFT_788620 [Rickenella mellea]
MAFTYPWASPVDRLPYELLAEIFEHCCLTQPTVKYPCARPSKDEAPLLLLGVCRKWRECVLATRSLWSRLCIGRISSANRVIYATAAKAWLDRAGSTPLSIDLCYARYADENTQDAVDHALQQVFTPARVWKVVYVEILGPPRADSTCIDGILNTVLGQSPALESFSFEVTGYWQNRDVPPTKTINMGYAPNLSTLSITFNKRIADFGLSFGGGIFDNVRDLKLLWFPSNNDCIEIVRRCPNVEVLHVSLRAPKHLGTGTTVHTLAKLHTLSVNAVIDVNHDVAEFLDALCTPALTELTMDSKCNSWAREPTRWPHLAHLLARSQPPLKSLTLLSTNMGGDDIISCLQHAPQLVILSGDGVVFGPEIMAALTPSAERAEIPMCSQLAMISLKGTQWGFSALATMIYARWTISRGRSAQKSGMSPVEVVEMPSNHRSSFLQCQGMAECEDHGLDLWFT